MDRIKGILFVILLLYSCYRNSVKLEKPIEVKETVEELKKQNIPEPIKQRTIAVLNQCEDYSKKAYEIVQQNQKQIDDLKAENSKLISRINELEEELKPWRMLKGSFALAMVGILVYGLIKLYLKVKPI